VLEDRRDADETEWNIAQRRLHSAGSGHLIEEGKILFNIPRMHKFHLKLLYLWTLLAC